MQDAWFRLLQQSAAIARGPLEARGPWHNAIVPPTKDGPECVIGNVGLVKLGSIFKQRMLSIGFDRNTWLYLKCSKIVGSPDAGAYCSPSDHGRGREGEVRGGIGYSERKGIFAALVLGGWTPWIRARDFSDLNVDLKWYKIDIQQWQTDGKSYKYLSNDADKMTLNDTVWFHGNDTFHNICVRRRNNILCICS